MAASGYCVASASIVPNLCPGFNLCFPSMIELGQAVDLQICFENSAKLGVRGQPDTLWPLVDAELKSGSRERRRAVFSRFSHETKNAIAQFLHCIWKNLVEQLD